MLNRPSLELSVHFFGVPGVPVFRHAENGGKQTILCSLQWNTGESVWCSTCSINRATCPDGTPGTPCKSHRCSTSAVKNWLETALFMRWNTRNTRNTRNTTFYDTRRALTW